MLIHYKEDLVGVDWQQMKAILTEDDFDNGRTPEQLATSFANSFASCIAYQDGKIVGTARVLSDGVCNAYVVDVWTYSPLRRHGIGREMMERLLARLQGQHVYLFTDEAEPFYTALGFRQQGTGMALVVGRWLVNNPGG
jgi:GNAT superfamily N-acetyltransferase